jgi:hypothetical protein
LRLAPGGPKLPRMPVRSPASLLRSRLDRAATAAPRRWRAAR